MSAVTIYCYSCFTNHELTASEAEVVIATLVAQWADAVTDDPDPLDVEEDATTVAYGWCAKEHLQWVNDGETYGEWIESARESRLSAARHAPEGGEGE